MTLKKKKIQIILHIKIFLGFFHAVFISNLFFFKNYWVVIYYMEKAMAPHSSTLAGKIPWMEEPGGLQSMRSHRVDWSDLAAAATLYYYWDGSGSRNGEPGEGSRDQNMEGPSCCAQLTLSQGQRKQVECEVLSREVTWSNILLQNNIRRLQTTIWETPGPDYWF